MVWWIKWQPYIGFKRISTNLVVRQAMLRLWVTVVEVRLVLIFSCCHQWLKVCSHNLCFFSLFLYLVNMILGLILMYGNSRCRLVLFLSAWYLFLYFFARVCVCVYEHRVEKHHHLNSLRFKRFENGPTGGKLMMLMMMIWEGTVYCAILSFYFTFFLSFSLYFFFCLNMILHFCNTRKTSEWVKESFLLFPFFSKYRRIFGFCRRRRQTHTLVSFGSANGPMVWRSNCNDFWILNLFLLFLSLAYREHISIDEEK